MELAAEVVVVACILGHLACQNKVGAVCAWIRHEQDTWNNQLMKMFANYLVVDLGFAGDTIATGDVVTRIVDCEGLGISVFLGVASIVVQWALFFVRQIK